MTLNGRMTVASAVACVLASSALLPLFSGSLWFVIGVGGVIIVAAGRGADPAADAAGAGLPGRRHGGPAAVPEPGLRGPPLAAVRDPHAGLPRRLWDLAGTGLHDAHRYAPPVPDLPGLVLLAAGGVGITARGDRPDRGAAAVHRAGRTAAAGPVHRAGHDERAARQLGTAVVFCLGAAGYLAMLSADGRERIRVWGRLVSLWRSARSTGCRRDRRRHGPAPVPAAGPGPGGRARTPGRWPRRAGGSGSRRSCWRCACRCSCPACTRASCSPRVRASAAAAGARRRRAVPAERAAADDRATPARAARPRCSRTPPAPRRASRRTTRRTSGRTCSTT